MQLNPIILKISTWHHHYYFEILGHPNFRRFQFTSVAQLYPTLCDPMDCSTPGLPVHHQLSELAQTHVHRVGDAIQHLILCRPLLLLPSIFPRVRVFSNESVFCIRWPKYRSFSFSISPSNEYSGLISFRMDWLDLLAVQGTLKSLQKICSRLNSTYSTGWNSLNIYHMPGSVPTVLQLTSVDSHRRLLSEMCCQSCVTGGQKWQHMWVKQQLETKEKQMLALFLSPEKGTVPVGENWIFHLLLRVVLSIPVWQNKMICRSR